KLTKQILELKTRMAQMKEALVAEEFEKQIVPVRRALDDLEKKRQAIRDELRPTVLDKHRHLLLQESQGDRLQKQEKLRLLEEMERALQKEAINLDVRAQKNRRNVVDLVEEKEELDREEKVWQRAADKILKMELEQDIPARVTPTDVEPMKDE